MRKVRTLSYEVSNRRPVVKKTQVTNLFVGPPDDVQSTSPVKRFCYSNKGWAIDWEYVITVHQEGSFLSDRVTPLPRLSTEFGYGKSYGD